MKHCPNKTVILGLLFATLVGCSHIESQQKVDAAVVAGNETVSANRPMPDTPTRPAAAVRSKGVWLGVQVSELMPDAALPAAFNTKVTMIFPGRVNITTVAERITNVTGVPVRVKPDVFLPASLLQPKGAGMAGQMQAALPAQGGVAGMLPGAVGAGGLPALPPAGAAAGTLGSLAATRTMSDFAQEMEVNYTGKLSSFLDMLSAKFGVNWIYRDGAIQMYRLVTKTLVLKENPGERSSQTDIGKTGGVTTGASAASGSASSGASSGTFNAAMSVRTQAGYSAWKNIKDAIDTVMTQVGRVSISESTGTIVITDTKEVVERVTALVNHENAILTKQVAVRVDVVRVMMSDKDEFGIDWSLVYSKLSNLTPQWTVKTASPATLTSASVGTVGISIVAPVSSDSSLTSRTSGSDALFRALGTVTRNVDRTSNTVVAKNRQPVPLAITNQLTYLAQTTPGTATAGAAGAAIPGLVPGVVTTGYLLNLLPTVLDNDAVMLQFSLDLSRLDRLDAATTGSGATLQQIQTPAVSGSQFQQQIGLRAGETLVISSFESNKGSYDRQTLGRNSPVGLGGSFTGGTGREAVVIMLTPMILQGV